MGGEECLDAENSEFLRGEFVVVAEFDGIGTTLVGLVDVEFVDVSVHLCSSALARDVGYGPC
jgi:hypothetical protein